MLEFDYLPRHNYAKPSHCASVHTPTLQNSTNFFGSLSARKTISTPAIRSTLAMTVAEETPQLSTVQIPIHNFNNLHTFLKLLKNDKKSKKRYCVVVPSDAEEA